MVTLLDVASIPKPILEIAKFFQQIPGVGEKTALKYALHIATSNKGADFGESLMAMALEVQTCPKCLVLMDLSGCPYCSRDVPAVCVVHRYPDLLAIEKSIPKRYRYFVLGHLISPLNGVQANDLPMEKLFAQVEIAEEVILALPPSLDGEATALYLARELATSTRTVTKPARGLAHGSSLEFADPVTMANAFETRKPLV